MLKNLRNSYKISKLIYSFMNTKERVLLILFTIFSISAAFSEGLGIGLFAQILSAQNKVSSFSNVPFFDFFGEYLASYDERGKIGMIAVMLVVITLLRALLQYLVLAMIAIIPVDLMRRLGIAATQAIQASSYGFIQKSDVGEVQTSVIVTTGNIGMMVQHLGHMLSNLILAAFYVAFLVKISPDVTFLVISGLALGVVILKMIVMAPSKAANKNMLAADSRRMSVLSDGVVGAKLIRLFNAQGLMQEKWLKAANNFAAAYRKLYLIVSISSPFMMAFVGCLGGVAIWGMLTLSAEPPAVWLTSILLFLAILLRLQSPVSTFTSSLNTIDAYAPSADKYLDFVNAAKAAAEHTGEKKIAGFQEKISFSNVQYSYDNSDKKQVKNLNLEIDKNSFVAFVGPSGAGKTTVMSLLCGLISPQHGQINVDGVDISELDLTSWRDKLAVVSQDVFLFDDNLYENIRFGRSATEEQVIEAAKMAQAHDFIMGLEKGYDTIIGERGTRLSGGQQQRIALARAILTQPDILILDEATSQLDSRTEDAIQRTVLELAKSKTIIAIAHRLSTIRHADKVVVLDHGEVVECGTHEELMQNNGIYVELRNLQDMTADK